MECILSKKNNNNKKTDKNSRLDRQIKRADLEIKFWNTSEKRWAQGHRWTEIITERPRLTNWLLWLLLLMVPSSVKVTVTYYTSDGATYSSLTNVFSIAHVVEKPPLCGNKTRGHMKNLLGCWSTSTRADREFLLCDVRTDTVMQICQRMQRKQMTMHLIAFLKQSPDR